MRRRFNFDDRHQYVSGHLKAAQPRSALERMGINEDVSPECGGVQRFCDLRRDQRETRQFLILTWSGVNSILRKLETRTSLFLDKYSD